MKKPRYKNACVIYSSRHIIHHGQRHRQGSTQKYISFASSKNENRPYDEEHNKYLLALFLGKDIDGNDLVDDKLDKTKYLMDNELPSPELLQQVMVTVRNITRINNLGIPRCSNEGCTDPAIKGGFCITHGAKVETKRKLCSID